MTSIAASRRGRLGPFSNAPVYVVGLALAAVVIAPIAYVVISGFRTTGQIASTPFRGSRMIPSGFRIPG